MHIVLRIRDLSWRQKLTCQITRHWQFARLKIAALPLCQSMCLVGAEIWVWISFTAIFAGILRGWFKLMTFRLLFSNVLWRTCIREVRLENTKFKQKFLICSFVAALEKTEFF